MTNYVQIDNIQNQRWKEYAEKIDGRRPDVKDPNDVGDAGDGKLSQRELKKLEQMITEYYNANPQKDSLNVTIPVQELVSRALKEVFGSTIKYIKFRAEQTFNNLCKLVSNAI